MKNFNKGIANIDNINSKVSRVIMAKINVIFEFQPKIKRFTNDLLTKTCKARVKRYAFLVKKAYKIVHIFKFILKYGKRDMFEL